MAGDRRRKIEHGKKPRRKREKAKEAFYPLEHCEWCGSVNIRANGTNKEPGRNWESRYYKCLQPDCGKSTRIIKELSTSWNTQTGEWENFKS